MLLGALLVPALAAGMPSAAGAVAPRVQVTVIGKHRVLSFTRSLRAVSTTVRVGHRRCAVGAGTPLAALLAVRRDVRLRDYGSCGRRAADSGQLFVTQVGPDRNRGRDGWVYAVNGVQGTAGAADMAGPFGAGRLIAGERVVWFWCSSTAYGTCRRPPR